VIFVAKDVSKMVFEGSFFGGVQNIWGIPYLNNTTVLFDEIYTSMHLVKTVLIEIYALHISLTYEQ